MPKLNGNLRDFYLDFSAQKSSAKSENTTDNPKQDLELSDQILQNFTIIMNDLANKQNKNEKIDRLLD